MKKLVVVMLMVMLVAGAVFAEKGDVEAGFQFIESSPTLYGTYNLSQNISVTGYIGYVPLESSVGVETLDFIAFGTAIDYKFFTKGKHSIYTGLNIGHYNSSSELEDNPTLSEGEATTSYTIMVPIKYTYNFDFGLVLGLQIMGGVSFGDWQSNNIILDTTPAITIGYVF